MKSRNLYNTTGVPEKHEGQIQLYLKFNFMFPKNSYFFCKHHFSNIFVVHCTNKKTDVSSLKYSII